MIRILIVAISLMFGSFFLSQTSFAQNIDIDTAIEKLEVLAKQGDVKANWQLYSIYIRGRPQYRNIEKGLIVLKRLSDKEIADAKEVMGDLYYYGRVVPQDYTKAAEWYAEYVKLERDPDILTRYATLYALGNGVEKDTLAAYKMYKEAAAQGYIPAYLLAQITYRNLGPIDRYFLK